jgi:hypothetical protein
MKKIPKNALVFTVAVTALGLLPLSALAGGKGHKRGGAHPGPSAEQARHHSNAGYDGYRDAHADPYAWRGGHRHMDDGHRHHRHQGQYRHGFNPFRSIHMGLRSGELTRSEARRLRKEANRLEGIKARAWRDGVISRREAKRIRKAEKRLKKNIIREMNDRQYYR